MQEFAATDRLVDDYVVPNDYTLRASPFVNPNDILAPEDMEDYGGHGTMVASVACGISQGVASQANLKIVKFRNAVTNAVTQRRQLRGVTDAALRDAWDSSSTTSSSDRSRKVLANLLLTCLMVSLPRLLRLHVRKLICLGFPRETNPNLLPSMKEFIMERVIPLAAENDSKSRQSRVFGDVWCTRGV